MRSAGLKKYWAGYRAAERNIYTHGVDEAARMVDESTDSVTAAKGYRAKINNMYVKSEKLRESKKQSDQGNREFGRKIAAEMEQQFGREGGQWKIFGTEYSQTPSIVDGYAEYYGYDSGFSLASKFMRQGNMFGLSRLC